MSEETLFHEALAKPPAERAALTQDLSKTTDPNTMLSLAEDLSAVAARMEPREAAAMLMRFMATTPDYVAVHTPLNKELPAVLGDGKRIRLQAQAGRSVEPARSASEGSVQALACAAGSSDALLTSPPSAAPPSPPFCGCPASPSSSRTSARTSSRTSPT